MSTRSTSGSSKTRILWLSTIGLLLAGALGCNESKQEKGFSLRLEEGPAPEQVLVRSDNSSVILTGAESSELTVEALVSLRISESRAAEAFERLKPTVRRLSDNPSTVEVRFDVPAELRRTSAAAQLEIQVPASVAVDVVTTNGRLQVSEVRGGADLKTTNGAIAAKHVSGKVVAETSNGRVDLNEIDGDVWVETSNGAVAASAITGGVQARTSNGRIRYTALHAPTQSVALRTSNGAIDVELPGQAAIAFDLDTSNGKVDVHGAEALKISSKNRTHLAGTVGEAGPELKARTSNGAIQVTFKG